MKKNDAISVILPVYNESENISEVIEEVNSFLQDYILFRDYELIVVDDGSKDNTGRLLQGLLTKYPRLKIETHQKNSGYARALISGIQKSKQPLVLLMDADGQFKIKEILKLISQIEEYDIVIGYRDKRNDNLHRIIYGKLFSRLTNIFFSLGFKDVNCGFKLFRRNALEDINKINTSLFSVEILLRARNKDYAVKEIPVEHFSRLKGKSTGASRKVIFKSIIDLLYLKFLVSFKKYR